MILIAIMLIEILAPSLARASGHLQDRRADRVTWQNAAGEREPRQTTETESAAPVLEQAIRQSFRPDVRVIPRDALDLSQLTMGTYVGVLYTAKGERKIVTGRVVATQADHIVVRSGSFFDNKRNIGRNQIDVLAVADDMAKIERWHLATQAIRSLREEPPRVRLRAPSISRQSITGSFAGSTSETLDLRSRNGIHRIPLSSIDEFAVSARRYRRTALGMKIGLVLAVLVSVAVPALAAAHIPGATRAVQTQAEVLTLGYFAKVGLPVFLGSTLAGALIISERWIEVSPQHLNLSLAPTQNRGLRAAMSFNF